MTSQLNRLSDGTLEISLTIPWTEVKVVYNDVLEDFVKNVELPGFRKGKAPKDLAESKIDKAKAYEEVIKRVVPKAYGDAISAENLRPIIMPKIELKEAQEGKDWLIIARTCEKPEVGLGDYKKAVGDLKSENQKKIWLPGQDPKKDEPKSQKLTVEQVLNALYKTTTVKIPAILLENEINRLLSELIDQTRKLGLTIDQYLTSTGRSQESIRGEYREQAQKTISLEFTLEVLAEKEKIAVEDSEIERVIKEAKTEQERKALEKERYFLASVLRRQKTLDFLVNL